jgi:hypothetical protein
MWLGTIDPPEDVLAAAGPEIGLEHQEATVSRLAAGDGDFAFDLVRFYQRGSADAVPRISAELKEAAARDRIPFVSWKVALGAGAWGDVADGRHDEDIVAVAEVIARSGLKMFLTVHHEPENDPAEGGPGEYVAMWRHVHDLVETTLAKTPGGGDVVWVLNYQGHANDASPEIVEAYYPGEAYVDWIAYNPYNWAGCHDDAQWRSFEDVAAPMYDLLTSDARFFDDSGMPKPLMIGETGTNEGPAPSQKAEWLAAMADTLRSGRFPHLRAVVYFNHAQPVFCDRHWDTSPAAARAFVDMAADPFFNPRGLDAGIQASRDY